MQFLQAYWAFWLRFDQARRACVFAKSMKRWILRRVMNKKQRPSGEEVRRALLVLIDNWEEECCRSHQGALGGGVRSPEVVLNINLPIGNG